MPYGPYLEYHEGLLDKHLDLPLSVAYGPDWFAFRIAGQPVSQNQAYKRGRGKQLYKTEIARVYQENLKLAAIHALHRSDWDLDAIYDVEIVYHFNSNRSDGNNPVKLTLDALEGTAYNDDKQVRDVLNRKRLDKEFPRTTIIILNKKGQPPTW